jgi:hypothetical protein
MGGGRGSARGNVPASADSYKPAIAEHRGQTPLAIPSFTPNSQAGPYLRTDLRPLAIETARFAPVSGCFSGTPRSGELTIDMEG